jgi:hypothetical protein
MVIPFVALGIDYLSFDYFGGGYERAGAVILGKPDFYWKMGKITREIEFYFNFSCAYKK